MAASVAILEEILDAFVEFEDHDTEESLPPSLSASLCAALRLV